jgi:hypothetical protein
MTYTDYLKSPEWKRIRGKVLRRDKRRCRSCGRRASQVHHASYDPETLKGKKLDRLYSLCGRCHVAVSFNVLGRKRDFREQQEWALVLDSPKVRREHEREEKQRKARRRRRHLRRQKPTRAFSTDLSPRLGG